MGPSTQLSIVAPGYCPQTFVAPAQVGGWQVVDVPVGVPPLDVPLPEVPAPLDVGGAVVHP